MDESFTPIDTTYGSAFLGLVISAILYGITILQVYFYYRNYPRDARFIKILVFTVWLWDTLHLSLCTTAIYWYLITNYARPDALEQLTWSMELQTDCNGIIALIVQCFFARRLWIMSSNLYLVSAIVTLSCIHFGLGIVFTIQSFALVTTANFQKLIWVTSAGIGSAAAADIMIAASLCYYLSRSKTGFRRTDSLITILIIYTVTTGLMTSVIDFAIIITFALMPNNYVWLALFWVVGRCYVNSFLAALNCRDSLREKAATRDPASFMHLTPITGSVASDRRSLYGGVPPLAVTIHTATVQKTDYLDSPESISTAPAALA